MSYYVFFLISTDSSLTRRDSTPSYRKERELKKQNKTLFKHSNTGLKGTTYDICANGIQMKPCLRRQKKAKFFKNLEKIS